MSQELKSTNSNKEKATILLSCPDKRGIVAEVAFFVTTYEGNIVHAAQHKDEGSNTFFMRIEWDISTFKIPKEKIFQAFEPIAMKYKMNWQLHFSSEQSKVAIFVSKYDHCLYELLIRQKGGELDCKIAAVISNHQETKSIADYFNIPFYYIPVEKGKNDEAEKKQLDLLNELKIDLVILARYMQIIGPNFVELYPNRIINIHHSFLPAFVGAKPYHQAYERGVKIIGATSHYVTNELDQGPILVQKVAHISHRDSIEDLITKGKDLEKNVLSEAVKCHLRRRVLVFNNKTVVFDE